MQVCWKPSECQSPSSHTCTYKYAHAHPHMRMNSHTQAQSNAHIDILVYRHAYTQTVTHSYLPEQQHVPHIFTYSHGHVHLRSLSNLGCHILAVTNGSSHINGKEHTTRLLYSVPTVDECLFTESFAAVRELCSSFSAKIFVTGPDTSQSTAGIDVIASDMAVLDEVCLVPASLRRAPRPHLMLVLTSLKVLCPP